MWQYLKLQPNTKRLPLFGNQLRNFLRSEYDIPEEVKNTLILANASVYDNINYYYHSAIQLTFKEIKDDICKRSPNLGVEFSKKYLNSVIKKVEVPRRILRVMFPIQRDNKCFEIIKGCRVHHGEHRYPALGGLRFCDKLNEDDLYGFATLATYKHACMKIPCTGSHGVIEIDPKKYSTAELNQIVQEFSLELFKRNFSHPSVDVFQPDMNCSFREMNWIAGAFQKHFGFTNVNSDACAVGKSYSRKGIQGYEQASGQAVFYGVNHMLNETDFIMALQLKSGWTDKTFIIQGFGKVGECIARYFAMAGAKCVGILEKNFSMYKSDGIDMKALYEHKELTGSIEGFTGAGAYGGDLLTESCDILVLAANHKALHCHNAPKLKTKIVVEAADGAITPSAHKILVGKCILVVPDIYISTGYALAGYYEYLKNINHIGWGQLTSVSKDESKDIIKSIEMQLGGGGQATVAYENPIVTIGKNEEGNFIHATIDKHMEKIGADLVNTCEKYKLAMDVRTACYINSVKRIFCYYNDSDNFQ